MKKLFLFLMLAKSAWSQDLSPQAWVEVQPYINYPDAQALINRLVVEKGLDRATLNAIFSRIQRNDGVLEKISKPAEKTKPWYEYKKIFEDEARFQSAQDFYHQYVTALHRAEEIYGVDPFIIVGIMAVETRFGKVTGKTNVLEALSTLCFDYPKRAKFFCSELEHYLLLSQRERFPAFGTEILGSYAGAMGMAQFMPSSYYNDAVDGNGDGTINLWEAEDAIFSIGNYLKNRGWVRDHKVYTLQLPDNGGLNDFGKGIKPYFVGKKIVQKTGVYGEDVTFLLNAWANEKLGSLILQGEAGNEYWLTHHNFYVITRYNTSPMYAMAVVNLAKRLHQSVNKIE